MASITLPMPRQNGSLANIVDLILVQKNRVNGCQNKREKAMSTEERNPWHVLNETRTRLCLSGYMVDLAAAKLALQTNRNTLQHPSTQKI
jgi:hypothetical protein